MPLIILDLVVWIWPSAGLQFVSNLLPNQAALATNCLTLSGLFLAALTILMAYLASDRMKKYYGTTGLRDLMAIFLDAVIISALLGILGMGLAVSQSLSLAPLSVAATGIVVARLLRTGTLLWAIMESHTKKPETLGDIIQAEIDEEKPLISHM